MITKKQDVESALEPRLLRVGETARYLGTTIWCVRQLAASGRLPVKRLGQRFLFDRKDLDRFADQL